MIQLPVEPAEPDMVVRLSFGADPRAVRRALRRVHAVLSGARVLEDDRAMAELVLAEVLNNVVEHAYAGHATGMIELALSLDAEALTCQVTDHGRPLPEGELPGPCSGGHDPQDLPEGGFGWPLIHRLTRDLGYCRTPGCNRLRFRLTARRRA
ncbi:ATP-binding protein [Frigidibacter sp. ROC022]|uniref:ATP-binding protein n=1 Tax=Frigidibacter sp. ROC022 TaxID=2971796 RepID=UPI00215AA786|nr:ATP-binding protein [Frigidibacter sp. ROC022]MCR8724970.1 ATP-binding protein [Frigidibacter sp. ROC022]